MACLLHCPCRQSVFKVGDVASVLKAKSLLCSKCSSPLYPPIKFTALQGSFSLWPLLLLLSSSLPLLYHPGLLLVPGLTGNIPFLEPLLSLFLLPRMPLLVDLLGSLAPSPPSSLCSNDIFLMKLIFYLTGQPILAPTAQHSWLLWFCSPFLFPQYSEPANRYIILYKIMLFLCLFH